MRPEELLNGWINLIFFETHFSNRSTSFNSRSSEPDPKSHSLPNFQNSTYTLCVNPKKFNYDNGNSQFGHNFRQGHVKKCKGCVSIFSTLLYYIYIGREKRILRKIRKVLMRISKNLRVERKFLEERVFS